MKGLEGTLRDNEACYSNCSYVGFHWDNKLGLARFESRIPEPFFGRDSKWELEMHL